MGKHVAVFSMSFVLKSITFVKFGNGWRYFPTKLSAISITVLYISLLPFQEYARLLQEKEQRHAERKLKQREIAHEKRALEAQQQALAQTVLPGYQRE